MQAALAPTARPAFCARPAARKASRASPQVALAASSKSPEDHGAATPKTPNDGETRPYTVTGDEPAYDSDSRKAQKEAYRAKEKMNDGTATPEEAAKAGNKANKSGGNSG